MVCQGTAGYGAPPRVSPVNDVGHFSINVPDMGVLHVTAHENTKKGFGYIADFVYDGTANHPKVLAANTGYN